MEKQYTTLHTNPPVRLTNNALDTIRNARMTDKDVQRDIELLQCGVIDYKNLLDDCLNGVEDLCGEEDFDDIRSGYEEYVMTLAFAIKNKAIKLPGTSHR